MATFISLSYPNLHQDPNLTTQSLLAQISQQLSNATVGDASSTAGLSVQSDFVPPISAVFINTAWFLSLVLSLSCALMATLLQHWARRYLHIVQRKYEPLHGARVHEYFSRGARRIGIFALVEVLPLLLLLSVFLFFAGLVVFAFRGNNIVAYFTLAIAGFFALSYIALSLIPLIFHGSPFQTPLTLLFRFSDQAVQFIIISVLHRAAKQMYDRWGAVSEGMARSFRERHKKMVKSLSENIIYKLENSTEPLSMDMYKKLLVRTLHWLTEDHELEEFVAGFPGLYESEAFVMPDNSDVQRNIRSVLAVLPGPTSFYAPLSWSIIRISQRASNLSNSTQLRRTKICLRALYYIPGAIRDLLAPYAAGKHYCLEILPLLNSPESLKIIEELWNTLNDDVALSVRCAAAVVAAFMITPPRRTLDTFDIRFIGDDNAAKQFLATRFRVDSNAYGGAAPEYHPSDSVRLQNIVYFLADIKDALQYMDSWWGMSDNADSIRRERRALFEMRHTEEYRTGRGTFDQHGNRSSPAFISAVQQDLITLTLEILARDPVADAAPAQREAFRDACHQLGQVAVTQAREQARAQRHLLQESRTVLESWALAQAQAVDSIEMIRRALEPVLLTLRLQIAETLAPHDDTSPPQTPELQLVAAVAAETVSTTDTPGPEYVGSAHRPSLPPFEETPSISQYPPSSSRAGLEAATGELGYPIQSDAPV